MSTRSRWIFGVVVALGVAVFLAGRPWGSATGAVPGSLVSHAAVSPSPARATAPTPTPVGSGMASSPSPAPSTPLPAATAAVPTTEAGAEAPPQGAAVTVVITSSRRSESTGSAEARGFVEVIESGGQCTLRLTRGSVVVEQVTDATTDATTTSCGTVSVPASKLTAGTWTGVLLYSSATASGSSLPFTIEVP